MTVSSERLVSIIERVEHLEEERRSLASDIRDIYSEAKASGYDVKVLKRIIAIRRMDPEDIAEQESLVDIYMTALENHKKDK